MIKSSVALTIVEPTALTTAYAGGWASPWFDVSEFSRMFLCLTVVKGSLTSIEVKVEVEGEAVIGTSAVGFATWKIVGNAASPHEVVILAADLAATDYVALPFDPTAIRSVRLRAKGTGTLGGATLGLDVLGGNV